jgi:hypothetical protein
VIDRFSYATAGGDARDERELTGTELAPVRRACPETRRSPRSAGIFGSLQAFAESGGRGSNSRLLPEHVRGALAAVPDLEDDEGGGDSPEPSCSVGVTRRRRREVEIEVVFAADGRDGLRAHTGMDTAARASMEDRRCRTRYATVIAPDG